MTDDREQLVRRAWDAYNRGEIEETLAFLDPEIVVESPVSMMNAGTFHGIDGFLGWLGEWNEAWDSFQTEITEIELVGEMIAVTRMRQHGTGRGSGAEVTMEAGWIYEIRDGRCVYLALRPSFEEAVEAARARAASK